MVGETWVSNSDVSQKCNGAFFRYVRVHFEHREAHSACVHGSPVVPLVKELEMEMPLVPVVQMLQTNGTIGRTLNRDAQCFDGFIPDNYDLMQICGCFPVKFQTLFLCCVFMCHTVVVMVTAFHQQIVRG